MKNDAEDVAKWLARETGHVPEADEGYEEETEAEEETPRLGLPNKKHEQMRRFFDGLEIEKGLTAKRRAESMDAIDEADEMNKALKGSLPPTDSPGGEVY